MKTFLFVLLLLPPSLAFAQNPNVCFSPSNCCEKMVIDTVKSAKKSVKIAIFTYTNKNIHDAVLDAYNRDVKVTFVADKRQAANKYALIKNLPQSVKVYYNPPKIAIEHNKFLVVDDKVLITGSYNYTQGATKKNSENCLKIEDPSVVKDYSDRFGYLVEMYQR